MIEHQRAANHDGPVRQAVYASCPHCGNELSPWERVLLSVDRALMCRHCWYRIILGPPSETETPDASKESQ